MGSFENTMPQPSKREPFSSSKLRTSAKGGKKSRRNHDDRAHNIQETAISLATTSTDEALVYLSTVMDDMLYRSDT